MLHRDVQRLAAGGDKGVPALFRVIVLDQLVRVVERGIERDAREGVFRAGLDARIDAAVERLRGLDQRIDQSVYVALRVLHAAVLGGGDDVALLVLGEQGIEQLLCLRPLAVEFAPAGDGISCIVVDLFVVVSRQRLMKSCRVDLRRWDQVCDSFG